LVSGTRPEIIKLAPVYHALRESVFAPTARSRAALLAEGIPDEHIHVTGNTDVAEICHAIAEIAGLFPALQVSFPVHLDPVIVEAMSRMRLAGNPFGDGQASRRIVETLAGHFAVSETAVSAVA